MNPPRVELTIRITAEGQVQVSGPIQDQMLCYGLLEVGRDAIKAHIEKMTRSPIVPARPGDPFLLKKDH